MKRFSIVPLACYAVILGYAGYAWFHLGHWPYYAHPDPKELPHSVLLRVTSVVFVTGALSLVLIPAGYFLWRIVAAWRKHPVAAHRGPMALYFVGAALWVLDVLGGFSTSNIWWLLD